MENKYFKQLQKARSDEIAPGISGNLVRLAHLAAGSITSQAEREQIAATLESKAAELGMPAGAVAATVSELRGRWEQSQVREYLAAIGRKGGQTITEATRAASRANGQRGGRRAKKAE